MSLVSGAPGERRRFLDIVLSLGSHGYLQSLQRYRQILRHRNALLKRRAAAEVLAPWDDALVEWGSRVMVARARWIGAHAEAFARRYGEIGATVRATLEYRPGIRHMPEDATDEMRVAEAFAAELGRIGQRERDRAISLAGPHRDDLALLVDAPDGPIDLREFGSGGQMRTAAIALRMIESETVRAVRGRPPLILLDDVFAELDPGRSRRILEMLDAEQRGQVILTAPKESDVELRRAGGFISSLAPWRIEAGRIRT
jgi:DNA replication and repair protein RecF